MLDTLAKEQKIERLWKEIFALQKEPKLCLLDQLQYSDLKNQLETLLKEV
jgi:hypothetical protein